MSNCCGTQTSNALRGGSKSSLYSVLCKQDANATNKVISLLSAEQRFTIAATQQTQSIMERDADDAEKLRQGVQIGIDRGTLTAVDNVTYKQINVVGKTPDDVSDEIITDVGSATSSGSIIVLVGLSGTGKGTTVTNLASKLPNCVTWSNGNVFRCLTLLASTYAKKHFPGESFDKVSDKVMTSENIASFVESLFFEKVDGSDSFDIIIRNEELAVEYNVEDVKNTVLKSNEINKNIPTVAGATQGEAIVFARSATKKLRDSGKNVLLEGRQQTVDHIESEFRYELVLSDTKIIGERRVAQIVAANAMQKLGKQQENLSDADVESAIREALAEFEV